MMLALEQKTKMSLGLVSALGYNIEASVRALLGALSSFSTKVMIDFRNWNKELIKFLELSTMLTVAVGKKALFRRN